MEQPRHPTSSDQNGFILITSLLFLVIITLLALSGIGSSTLQQKMATNSNNKSVSLQDANSTLAHAETLIQHGIPPNMKKKNVCYGQTNIHLISNGCSIHMHIDTGSHRRSAISWLNHNLWTNWKNNNKVQTYKSLKTTYRIKVTKKAIPPPASTGHKGTGLKGSHNARSKAYYFTITARSKGTNKQAPAVTQSVYRKRY